MKRKVVTIEEQYIKVYSRSVWLSGQGFNEEIPGEVYFDEPYIDGEQEKELLHKAYEADKGRFDTWLDGPKVEIYWRTISKNIKYQTT